jgi:4,5-DOPA dioxygenase extradiol
MGAAGDDRLGAQRIDAGIDAGLLAMDIYRFDGERALADPVAA